MEQDGRLNHIISMRGVGKTYYSEHKTNEVVQNIDLDIYENEFVVLFGPGQCGKTTILNLIAGLQLTTKGEVYVAGKKVAAPGPDRGVVYQRTALFPFCTVMENVKFGPKSRGLSKSEQEKTAQYFVNLVGLQGFENVYPNRLSGGMRQRVGIARAYANDPKVLLMDEPFGHLDAQTRYMMEAELEKIWNKEKRTVVFVTNNSEEAVYLADRIIILTNTPTHIKDEVKVDLKRPRKYSDPEFLAIRKKIENICESTL